MPRKSLRPSRAKHDSDRVYGKRLNIRSTKYIDSSDSEDDAQHAAKEDTLQASSSNQQTPILKTFPDEDNIQSIESKDFGAELEEMSSTQRKETEIQKTQTLNAELLIHYPVSYKKWKRSNIEGVFRKKKISQRFREFVTAKSKDRKAYLAEHPEEDTEYDYNSDDDHNIICSMLHKESVRLRFNEFYISDFSVHSQSWWLAAICNQMLHGKWNSFMQIAKHAIGLPCITPLTISQISIVAFNRLEPVALQNNFGEFEQFIERLESILEGSWELLLELLLFFTKTNLFKGKLLMKLLNSKAIANLSQGHSLTLDHHVMMENLFELFYEHLEFIEWKRDQTKTMVVSKSSGLIAQKIINNLINHVTANYEHVQYDISILMLLEMLELSPSAGACSDVFAAISAYAEKRSNHLNAQIYLFEFLSRHEYLDKDRKLRFDLLQKIVRLDPSNDYCITMVSEYQWTTTPQALLLEYLNVISNFLDYNRNHHSKVGWQLMVKLVESRCEDTSRLVPFLARRLKYWEAVHFRLAHLQKILPTLKQFHKSNTAVEHMSSNEHEQFESDRLGIYFAYSYKSQFLHNLSQLMDLNDQVKRYHELLMSALL